MLRKQKVREMEEEVRNMLLESWFEESRKWKGKTERWAPSSQEH